MNKYDVSEHMTDLITLARGDNEDNMPNFSAAPSMVQNALKKKMAEAVEKAAENAAEVIMAIINAAKDDAVQRSEDVRRYKERIEHQKTCGAERDRAYAYGMATDNWLPLGAFLGLNGHVDDSKLCSVPKDWVPPTE
jgi:hypothetical protein